MPAYEAEILRRAGAFSLQRVEGSNRWANCAPSARHGNGQVAGEPRNLIPGSPGIPRGGRLPGTSKRLMMTWES